jgi:hypothetical protein
MNKSTMKLNTRTNVVETPIKPIVQKKSKKETIKPTSNVDAAHCYSIF